MSKPQTQEEVKAPIRGAKARVKEKAKEKRLLTPTHPIILKLKTTQETTRSGPTDTQVNLQHKDKFNNYQCNNPQCQTPQFSPSKQQCSQTCKAFLHDGGSKPNKNLFSTSRLPND